MGWRRVLTDPHHQPPDAPLSRGLEVHPDAQGDGDALDVWVERSLVRRGYGWRVPAGGEARIGVGSYDPHQHVRAPTDALAARVDAPAVRYQGNWFPHRLRAATDGEVLYVGDSAGHCFPLSGEGIRTAFYFGIAAGRELRAVLAGDEDPRAGAGRLRGLPRRPRAGLPARAAPAAPRPGAPAADADPRPAGAQRRSRWSIAPSAGTSSRPTRGWLAQSATRVEIAYDERGLVPVVVQDWRTGEVLTLAYANAEAVARTRETGELHLWSRSRGELWHKGATSGHTQRVRALRLDCDGDALLALVEPDGPGVPHRRAHVLSQRRARAARARTRRCRRSSARSPSARRRAPRGLLHRRAARRPAAHRRQGPGGGRGGRPRGARGARRARRRGGRRRPLPPHRAAARARPRARRRRGGAQWPSPLIRSADCASSRRSTRCASWRASTTSSPCATASSTTSRRRSAPS